MNEQLKVFEYEERECLGIGVEGDDERTIADVWDHKYAKLFAAAPALLAACKAYCHGVRDTNEIGRMIHDAYAKAGGVA